MQMGAREKRSIVVVGLAVVVYLIYAFLLSPTLERQKHVREELETNRLLLTKYQTTAARRSRILSELNQAKAKLAEFESRLLTADKPPLAASQLQQIINEVGTKVGMDVRSISILGPRELGAYVEISISLVFVGNSPKLKAFLQEIESHRLRLQINELVVNVINPEIENNMQVTMVVFGLTKKEG